MSGKSFFGRSVRALSLVALLSGCAVADYIEEKGKIDYKSASGANRRVTLETPPDLISPRGDERYALPQRAGDRTLSSFERDRATGAARPAVPGVLPPSPGMRIERAGAQRWLRVDAPAESLWPAVRSFWEETGFKIDVETPEAGIMETDWAENRARIPQDFIRRTIGRVFENAYSSGERDRFRTRLERVEGGTEITISHRGVVEVMRNTKDGTTWERRPTDSELENELLNRLMLKLGGKSSAGPTAVVSPAVAAERDVRISGAGPDRGLDIDDPFDRAWRRVGVALDRGGFTVEDRDRSRGAYFVRYIDADEQARAAAERPGFLSRLFSGARKSELSQQYRLVLVSAGTGTRLSVLDKDGKPTQEADRVTVTRIVDMLMQQMLQ